MHTGRAEIMGTAGWTRVVTNATVATCSAGPVAYGLCESGAVALAGERIA
jgi:hypothetical protein